MNADIQWMVFISLNGMIIVVKIPPHKERFSMAASLRLQYALMNEPHKKLLLSHGRKNSEEKSSFRWKGDSQDIHTQQRPILRFYSSIDKNHASFIFKIL
ncbi:hypothetical protein CEXT_68891 [Caerostris extrusa]|uniref:Ycf15 n=1 Tax=Caerostris extrusa TaxID=172846 RepID=A0AAV4TD23_CAEEX|nr:hypothetical protein CEXT_68891 [Caerostris extrusa]